MFLNAHLNKTTLHASFFSCWRRKSRSVLRSEQIRAKAPGRRKKDRMLVVATKVFSGGSLTRRGIGASIVQADASETGPLPVGSPDRGRHDARQPTAEARRAPSRSRRRARLRASPRRGAQTSHVPGAACGLAGKGVVGWSSSAWKSEDDSAPTPWPSSAAWRVECGCGRPGAHPAVALPRVIGGTVRTRARAARAAGAAVRRGG